MQPKIKSATDIADEMSPLHREAHTLIIALHQPVFLQSRKFWKGPFRQQSGMLRMKISFSLARDIKNIISESDVFFTEHEPFLHRQSARLNRRIIIMKSLFVLRISIARITDARYTKAQ